MARIRGAPSPVDHNRAMEVGQTETSVSSAVGVHLIHTVPDGLACVYDQAVRTVRADQTFEALLYAEYKDAEVAQQLAEANELLPGDDGTLQVYVPVGDPVVIPEMCYAKEGANAVSLQASGLPEESVSGEGAAAGLVIVVMLIGGLILTWRWLSSWASGWRLNK